MGGEKLAEKTHWRQEGGSSFHLTSHRQNKLCLLHKSYTDTRHGRELVACVVDRFKLHTGAPSLSPAKGAQGS